MICDDFAMVLRHSSGLELLHSEVQGVREEVEGLGPGLDSWGWRGRAGLFNAERVGKHKPVQIGNTICNTIGNTIGHTIGNNSYLHLTLSYTSEADDYYIEARRDTITLV